MKRLFLAITILLGFFSIGLATEPNINPDDYIDSTFLTIDRIPPSFTSETGQNSSKTWTDPTTGMEFVWIAGGCYMMGSNDGNADEKPVHRVCVDGFGMGKYEVTQDEWKKLMGSNPSYSRGNRTPVEQVSWNDVQEFIRKLNSKGNGKFRLPTEAEWEYVARSGGQRQEYSGGAKVDDVAWSFFNSDHRSHKVGTKSPNDLGLYDMSGNVWEWCEDKYYSKAYSEHSYKNPIYTTKGDCRVIRGGSWDEIPKYSKSTYRQKSTPSETSFLIGFRLVRTN